MGLVQAPRGRRAAAHLALELVFLTANALKIPHGGWVPILMAAAAILLMWTWVRGTSHVRLQARRSSIALESLIQMLAKSKELRLVPGTAVFLTSDPDVAPDALLHNLKHNHVLHEQNVIVSVTVETKPYVADAERLTITRLSDHFTRIDMHFGFIEETNLPRALGLARKQGLRFDIMSTSFFLSRRSFRKSKTQGLPFLEPWTTIPRAAG